MPLCGGQSQRLRLIPVNVELKFNLLVYYSITFRLHIWLFFGKESTTPKRKLVWMKRKKGVMALRYICFCKMFQSFL